VQQALHHPMHVTVQNALSKQLLHPMIAQTENLEALDIQDFLLSKE